MIRYFFLLFIFGIGSAAAQSNKKLAKDTIVWSKDVLLTKENFQAKRGPAKAMAATASAILVRSELKGPSLLIYVEAVFSKSKSYMKEDQEYVLNHEQIHFDITELYARKLRKLISEKDFTKVKNVVDVVQRFTNKIVEEAEREQAKYDGDTENGLNAAKQKLWNDKVKSGLAELELYSSVEIDIAN